VSGLTLLRVEAEEHPERFPGQIREATTWSQRAVGDAARRAGTPRPTMTVVRPSPVRAVVGHALRLVALAAVVALHLLVGAPAASAHDGLAGSVPAAGAVLTAAPAAVTLTFEETPLPTGLGVVVRGPNGELVTSGDPTVSGNDVVTPLVALTANGTYTVSWRVVATDGHPTKGTFTFRLALASTSPTSSTPSTPSTSSTPTGVTTAAPEPSASSSELGSVADSPGVDLTPWMVGGSALLLVVILVVGTLGVLARRRSR
jgi:methionine-rich copper-binding protein CopC